MRIALVHDWLTGMRGGEKCLEALCQLWPQAHVYTLLHQRGRISREIESRPIHTSFLQHVPGIFEHYRWFLPLMPAAIRNLKLRNDYDVVISLSHAVAKGLHVPPGVPHLCYCFTPMRWAWHCYEDYFGSANAKAHGGQNASGARQGQQPDQHGINAVTSRIGRLPATLSQTMLQRFMASMRRWDQGTAEKVTHFIAISHAIAGRIRECYGRESAVIYPPVATDFYTPSHQTREPFYLCVSALVPYKRVDLAVDACSRLGRRLVIIGQGPESRALRDRAGPSVRFLGWQPDDVIRDHLRRCRALIFPGKEDFGIVPVEAQACGAPIIAYGQGGATETIIPCGEHAPGNGVFFYHQTADSLMRKIGWLEQRPDRFCSSLARRAAERFARARFQDEMAAYVAALCRQQETERATTAARRRFDPRGPATAGPHVTTSDQSTVGDTAAAFARGARRLRGALRTMLPSIVLAIVLACVDPLAADIHSGLLPRKIDLPALNHALAGRVLDFTQNHSGDHRICSESLHQWRDLYVYLPPHYSRAKTYPLVLWLHGYGGDERQFLRQAVVTLDRAIVNGDLPPVIAAAPDGSLRGDFRLWGHGSWFTNSHHGRFEDYVVEDVMGFLVEQFPIASDPSLRVVVGWSMGGFAAYKMGMRFPAKFRVLVGIYPNLDMRWCDRQGHYSTDFDPKIASQFEELPRWKLMGIVPNVKFPVTFGWAIGRIWGRGKEAIARISAENPAEIIDRYGVSNGQFDLLIAYGKQDEYNVDAQVESFLHRARERGLNVWVRYHPEGHHTAEYVTECLPDVWREVGVRLRHNERAEHLARRVVPAERRATAPLQHPAELVPNP